MKGLIHKVFDSTKPLVAKDGPAPWAWPIWEALEIFVLVPGEKTKKGAHVRDIMDTKRLMITVLYALLPAMFMGMWNVGYQAYVAEGVASPDIFMSILRGAYHMLPIVLVSYSVGGFWEFVFAAVRKHEISEGFLVTGMLFPLILAPSTPLWMVAMGVSFGVVIGKEVFGGVGMNVLNPALTARAFVFFAYPAAISGDTVWNVAQTAGTLPESFFSQGPVVDGFSGATPLAVVSAAESGTQAVTALTDAGYSWLDLFIGMIPGSMGEVSTAAIVLGLLVLIVSGVASWRVIFGAIFGIVGTTLLLNVLAGPENSAYMTLPPHYHLVMGGFAFGAVYMATDPVTAAITPLGKVIYGTFIGVLAGLVRVVNPAYPEGMMLAILFMNVFAPLVDYYVVQGSRKRRKARLATA